MALPLACHRTSQQPARPPAISPLTEARVYSTLVDRRLLRATATHELPFDASK